MDTWTDKKKKLLEPIIISSPKSIVVATCYFLGCYVLKCSISSCAEMSGICRFQSGCNCYLSRCTIIQIIDKYHNIPNQNNALNNWCPNAFILLRTILNKYSLVLNRINVSIYVSVLQSIIHKYNVYTILRSMVRHWSE